MTRRFSIAAALTAAAVVAWSHGATAETIRIATEGAYPPFNYIDQSGELKGFDVDIANALCERMKADCEVQAQAWDGIIPGLVAGKYDAIIASMSITPKRKEAVNFTRPYYQAGAALVAAKDSGISLQDPSTLKGKTIGVQRASTYADFLKQEYPDVTVKLYDTVENHNLDLTSGRLDGVVAQRVFMHEWLEKEGNGEYEIKGNPILNEKYIGEGAGIALRKEDGALRDHFDTALAEILADGTYDQINARYFPFSIRKD